MSQQYLNVPEGKDPELWDIAQKRAGFKKHLTTYVVINAFLWAIWYFTDGTFYKGTLPWPLWSTLGWGIGIAFHFSDAYVLPKSSIAKREYEKLKSKQQSS